MLKCVCGGDPHVLTLLARNEVCQVNQPPSREGNKDEFASWDHRWVDEDPERFVPHVT